MRKDVMPVPQACPSYGKRPERHHRPPDFPASLTSSKWLTYAVCRGFALKIFSEF